MDLLDHILFSVFIETTILFSTVAVPSYGPATVHKVSNFPHLSQHLLFSVWFVCFLIVAIRCEGISHSFDFCFPKSFTQS